MIIISHQLTSNRGEQPTRDDFSPKWTHGDAAFASSRREISRLTNVEKRKRRGEDEAIDFSVHSPTLVVCNVTRATYLTTFVSGGRARDAATIDQP